MSKTGYILGTYHKQSLCNPKISENHIAIPFPCLTLKLAMDLIILSNLAARILTKLSSLLSEEFGMLCGLKDDVNKLICTLSIIRATLVDAHKWPTGLESVAGWLEKLEAVLNDADDVLDEFSDEAIRRTKKTKGRNAKQVRIFFSNSNQLVFNFRMARQVKKIRERLDAIADHKNFLWS